LKKEVLAGRHARFSSDNEIARHIVQILRKRGIELNAARVYELIINSMKRSPSGRLSTKGMIMNQAERMEFLRDSNR